MLDYNDNHLCQLFEVYEQETEVQIDQKIRARFAHLPQFPKNDPGMPYRFLKAARPIQGAKNVLQYFTHVRKDNSRDQMMNAAGLLR